MANLPLLHPRQNLTLVERCQFTEYKIDGDEAARANMTERANGRRSVPQIFINNQHIGGCDDLYNLDTNGQLDPLLFEAIGNG